MELKMKSASLMTILALSAVGCGSIEVDRSLSEKSEKAVANVEKLKEEGVISTDKKTLGINRGICEM